MELTISPKRSPRAEPLGQTRNELFSRLPSLTLSPQQSQILCHPSCLNSFDTDVFQNLCELSHFRGSIELSAVSKPSRPCEDGRDRVRRCRLATLVLPIMASHSSMRSLSFKCTTVRR